MNSYERFCFNLLGKWVKTKRDNYLSLRNDLISARFKTPFEVYLSTAYVTSIVVGLVFALVIGIISWVLQSAGTRKVQRVKFLMSLPASPRTASYSGQFLSPSSPCWCLGGSPTLHLSCIPVWKQETDAGILMQASPMRSTTSPPCPRPGSPRQRYSDSLAAVLSMDRVQLKHGILHGRLIFLGEI